MALVIFSGFLLAFLSPWFARGIGKFSGWFLSLYPFSLVVYFVHQIGPVIETGPRVFSYPWVTSLGINLTFYLDGLSLLFALLICGIGGLVLIYSSGYLAGHNHLGRFFAFFLLFLVSMLGLVLAHNLILLFVFWELTSLSSYFLIGFQHQREEARTAALQALLVTGLGGLALLAGFVLLALAGGSLELALLMERGQLVRDHILYLPLLLLILGGTFTKSAQFPFHFWLPNAMEAPTPVSAYLHSATMVKAGVYLLARLNPLLGLTDEWLYIVTATGAITMGLGAYLALRETVLKRLLAYSTISALGALTLLLGLGTASAVRAAMVLLLAHALYKGALFLVAGAIDHQTGESDVDRLGGLRRAMPITAVAGALAALSMAGLPPFLGFISKESILGALWEAPRASVLLTAASFLTSVFIVVLAFVAGIKPFTGAIKATPKHPREASASLWGGPLIMAGLGLLMGVMPAVVAGGLLTSSSSAVLGYPVIVKLGLWHGFNLSLAFSVIAVAAGVILFIKWSALRQLASRPRLVARWGPERWYFIGLYLVNRVADAQTRLFQSGYLRYYLLVVISTTVGLVGYTALGRTNISWPNEWLDIRFYEAVLIGTILLAAAMVVRSRSRLAAVAGLGVVGYGVGLIFLLFGGPDLAMTQFVVETLTVILFVLVFYHLPPYTKQSGSASRLRDLILALTAGGLMSVLVLVATVTQVRPSISSYFAEHSLTLAYGRNVVNVILVDFRALDTLGEITVLAVAGLGVYALLKLRPPRPGK